ncbi:MAG: ABC transporter permease [Cyclobacteriaceae bacterium]
MNSLKFVLASLRRQKFQALQTIILFVTGVSISVAVLSFTTQLDTRIEQNTRGIDLVAGAKGSPLQLILSSVFHADYPTGNIRLIEAEKLSRHRLVRQALPLALGDAYNGFRIVGTNDNFKEWYDCRITQGAWWKDDLEVVLGAEVSKRTGLNIGDTFASAHGLTEQNRDHEDVMYTVTGILEKSGGITDDLIITSVPGLWKVHHLMMKPVSSPSRLVPGADATDSLAEITALLIRFRNPIAALQLPRIINQGTTMQAASPAFEAARLQSLVGAGTEVLNYFAWMILGLSGLSILFSLLSGMRVRQVDIAIMRVMGAGRGKIFSIIIFEAVILSLSGALPGIIAGHLILALSGQSTIAQGLSPYLFQIEELYIILSAVIIGATGALIPAIGASRKEVHHILNQ